MGINKITFSNLLEKRLEKVLIKYDKSLKRKNILVADEIQFNLEDCILILTPILDTEEIDIQIVNGQITKPSDKIFDKFLGLPLMYTWSGLNTKGYNDVFLLAFEYLHPQILILSEGGLKIFFINEATL